MNTAFGQSVSGSVIIFKSLEDVHKWVEANLRGCAFIVGFGCAFRYLAFTHRGDVNGCREEGRTNFDFDRFCRRYFAAAIRCSRLTPEEVAKHLRHEMVYDRRLLNPLQALRRERRLLDRPPWKESGFDLALDAWADFDLEPSDSYWKSHRVPDGSGSS